MKQAANTLAEQTGGRFVLGLGVSHGPLVAGLRGLDYSKPLTTMRDVPRGDGDANRSVVVAPADAADRAARRARAEDAGDSRGDAGRRRPSVLDHARAHGQAREILGPDAMLCVEQKVVLSTDADAARAAANTALDVYVDLPNYRNNWLRLGFTDDEIEQRGTRFVDAVVVWGDEDRVRAGVQAHYDAGADHVCVQPLVGRPARSPSTGTRSKPSPPHPLDLFGICLGSVWVRHRTDQ